MDFLGDIGISHRQIHPKNLVLREATKYNLLKLTNFEKAILYWSVDNNEVIFIPCVDAKEQANDGKNYQSPEIYGNSNEERFDPIKADTWSYGSVIYKMATKKYPYHPKKQSNDLEEEIQKKVKKVSILSSKGKDLLGCILRTNAAERIPIGLIGNDSWFDIPKNVYIMFFLNANFKLVIF